MLIVGTFPHSIEVEQALAELEHSGVSRKQILVVVMETEPMPSHQAVKSTRDIHSTGVGIGMATATALSVIGASVGFVWKIGPILSGLIGGGSGFLVGFGLYYGLRRKQNTRRLQKSLPEVTVIVQCRNDQIKLVTEMLWTFQALTVGTAEEPDNRG
ncbi:hypothetical protein [Paenibacillus koleovorans]|uniref:hypothetical protein n=1 Tax=Paenibacillus koleovorans TaxID=121608 RepID=UPI000FDC227C|nr:hypothetical protein [Paenibacillus koleovorans]